jgi:DNA-binding response OmpR family regulator
MKRILVVDETRSLSRVYFDLLSENYEVEASNDPKEIIPRAQRVGPYLVIVNADLPDFDAHEFCTTIKKEMKIPVLLLLDAHSSTTMKIDSCSADDIITKPFEKEFLIQTVEKLLMLKNRSSL